MNLHGLKILFIHKNYENSVNARLINLLLVKIQNRGIQWIFRKEILTAQIYF